MRADALAALNYAVKGSMHCRNYLLLYLDAFGIKKITDELVEVIAGLGLPPPMVIAMSLVINDSPETVARLVISRYLAAAVKPTCALFMVDASIVLPVVLGLASVAPPKVFDDLHFFATSVATLPQWVDPTTGSSAPFRNVYITSSLPSGHDRRFEFVRAFQTATQALKASGTLPVTSAFIPNPFAVDGYMAARVLIETVNRIGLGKQITRKALKDAVYRTRAFVIDDIILGPYSNGCTGQQSGRTGACWCTAGMKELFFSRVDGTTGAPLPVFDPPYYPGIAEVPIPLTQCGLDRTTLQRPFIAITPRDRSLGAISTTTTTSSSSISALLAPLGNLSDPEHPSAKVQERGVARLRAEVLAALKAQSLEFGPLAALSFDTEPSIAFTNETLVQLHTRYRLVFLMGAVSDPVKLYPQLKVTEGSTMPSASVSTQSATSTLPALQQGTASVDARSSNSHVLDIAPATSAFRDQDDPWLPPSAHLPLRIPFYPTLADFSVTAAAYAVRSLGLGARATRPSTSTQQLAGEQHIAIVADSATIAATATEAVETFARTAPTIVLTASAEGAAGTISQASTDALLSKAHLSSKGGRSGPSPSAVIVVTRQKAMIDAALRAAVLPSAASTTTVIASDEFVLEGIIQQLSVSSAVVSSNVVFVSGLPRYDQSHVSGDNRLSATESYSAAIAQAVKALYDLSGKSNGTAVEIATAAYRNLAVPIPGADISLSPLWADRCTSIETPTWPHPGGECQCAKGLNTFFVRSFMDAVMNDTASTNLFSYRHAGCGPAFKALDPPAESSSGLSATEVTAIAVGAALFVVMAATATVATWIGCCQRSTRDNSNAPVDPSVPFTMVFTDIQASTRLWAHAPDKMGEALDVHHRLLRQAVRNHRGYEVKTIGDSFMVAFKETSAALAFAFDVQLLLYNHDTETDVFEQVYKDAAAEALHTPQDDAALPGHHHLIDDAASEVSGLHTAVSSVGERAHPRDSAIPTIQLSPADRAHATPDAVTPREKYTVHVQQEGHDATPQTALSPEDYAALWNGLRVRVGIHHGTGSIRFEETTQGYDYYGTVVNTAARVEGVGHGGQVLLTDAAYECLGDAAIARVHGVVTDLGAQPLRGLPEPVRLFQVLPDAFAQRSFPPLRLDVEVDLELDGATTANDSAKGHGDGGTGSRRTSDTNTAAGQNRYAVGEIVGDLTKRLRLKSAAASKLSIAATFDAVSTLLAAMKPAARKDSMKALSAAWRVQGVWPQTHLRRMVRSSVFTYEQLLLLAAVGRSVQALQVQAHAATHSGHLAATPRGKRPVDALTPRRGGPTVTAEAVVADYEASISSTLPRGDSKAARTFVPGAGFDAVLRVLKTATAATGGGMSPGHQDLLGAEAVGYGRSPMVVDLAPRARDPPGVLELHVPAVPEQ